MKGYPLSMFGKRLERVPEGSSRDPLLSLKDELIAHPRIHDNSDILDVMYLSEWTEYLRQFPLSFLTEVVPFQTLIEVNYMSMFTFGSDRCYEFEKIPEHRIVQKIQNSFSRWGNDAGWDTWNTAVSIYEQLVTFTLPQFTCTLDWTTGYNIRGYSEAARIYLDGTFAYLVHYKGEHVMTIGFSFTDIGDLYIHQVQLVQAKGNRFLFKLPCHYMEWIVSLMRYHFIEREVFVVEGESLASVIYEAYYSQAQRWRSSFSHERRWFHKGLKKKQKKSLLERLKGYREDYKAYWQKAVMFRTEVWNRIVRLYSLPRLTFDTSVTKNNLVFRHLV